MSTLLDNLRRQCDGPRDGALLRYSLGSALLDTGDAAAAVAAFERALAFDPGYSAAWKLLGKAHLATGAALAAAEAWRRGIAAAGARGDKQAEKEMTVFLRRLQTPPAAGSADQPGPPSSS
ncbi:tetratricopeptide repeat protein [Rhodanobacter lindaniclasticus]